MEIKYTLHADFQIQERKIKKVWVEETIKFPDQIIKIGEKHYVTKKLNGKILKVVYVKAKEKHIKVVTVYWLT